MINTGGTLGMRKDEAGELAPVAGFFFEQMKLLAEREGAEALPHYDILEYGACYVCVCVLRVRVRGTQQYIVLLLLLFGVCVAVSASSYASGIFCV